MPRNLTQLGLPNGLVDEMHVATSAIVAFTEGPAVDAEGNVFFSDIVNNRIMKRAADGALSVWRADSGRANGNMFDAQGRLVTCEGAEFGDGGRRRLTRTDMRTGAVEVLTDRYEGGAVQQSERSGDRCTGPHLFYRPTVQGGSVGPGDGGRGGLSP